MHCKYVTTSSANLLRVSTPNFMLCLCKELLFKVRVETSTNLRHLSDIVFGAALLLRDSLNQETNTVKKMKVKQL